MYLYDARESKPQSNLSSPQIDTMGRTSKKRSYRLGTKYPKKAKTAALVALLNAAEEYAHAESLLDDEILVEILPSLTPDYFDKERAKMLGDPVIARRNAMFYHYVYVDNSPPEEEWDGKGKTYLAQLCKILKVPDGSVSKFKKDLQYLASCVLAGEQYDPKASKTDIKRGRRAKISLNGIEAQIIADAMELGRKIAVNSQCQRHFAVHML